MSVSVKLQAFEGPLDLLLHLIEKNKVNIYDIPIAEITDQYMECLHGMEETDLDLMSEFLLMAATLLDIKSRMLLPREINEDGEEEDPREELVQRLLEYKMYKTMSFELKDREIDTGRMLFRKESLPEEVAAYRPPLDLDVLMGDITLAQLNDVFQEVIRRSKDKIDPVRSRFGRIEKEEIKLEDKMIWLEAYARAHGQFEFRQMLEKQSSRMNIIVTFLAVLELMKVGKLAVCQETTFGDMQITWNGVRTEIGDHKT